MPDLVQTPAPSQDFTDVTTRTPQLYGNPAAAKERASETEARGLEEAGQGAMDVAIPFARREAAAGLENEKVSIGPDGKLQVINRPQSLIFGEAGKAYAQEVREGTAARADAAIGQKIAEIHQQFIGDPQGQATANQALVQGLQGATGDPILDSIIQQRAGTLAAGAYTHNLEWTAERNRETDVGTFKATREDALENAATLAQAGATLDGTGEASDKLRSEWGRYQGASEALQKVPGNRYPQEQRDLDEQHAKNRLTAESYMGNIDRYMTGAAPGGLAAAKKVVAQIEQMHNIDRQEKRILLQDANSRIASNYADYESRKQQNREENKLWEEGMTKGGLTRDSIPLISQAIQRTKDLGDSEEATRLQHLYDGWRAGAAVEALPEAQRNRALYGPAGSPAEPGAVPGSQPASLTPEAMSRALLGQESGGNPNAPTSVDNAHGIGQIIPATFALYAKPGEKIDNPADNLAVHQRIVADYTQRWPNDPARVAVAYFSGENNVAPPGSPTPYLHDTHDGNGKYVSSYVNDVLGRLGRGGAPSGSDRVPAYRITAQDVAKNPDLASYYLKQTLGGDENRYESARITMDALDRSVERGASDLPMDSVVQVKQYVDAHPDDAKAQELGARLNGALGAAGGNTGTPGGGGPPPPSRAEINDRATNGPDIFTRDAYGHWADLEKKRSEAIAKAPYDYAANPASRVLGRPVTPIDPQRPESIVPAIIDRYQASQVINQKMGIPAPAIFAQANDKAAFEQIMRGPQGSAAVTLMAQTLPPDVLMRMSDEPAFVSAVNAMRNSGDYPKAASAFAIMDTMNRQNSPEFDLKFHDGLKDLAWWQSVGSALPPDQLAKVQAERHDPGYEEKMRPFEKAAEDWITQNHVDAANVVGRLPGNGFLSVFSTPTAPAPGGVDNGANAELLFDWKNAMYAGARQGLDMNAAAAYADKTVQNKWTRSDVNGGRYTSYSPEQWVRNQDGSPATVNGSMDWLGKSLDGDLKSILGLPTDLRRGQTNVGQLFGGEANIDGPTQDRLAEFYGPRILQGDAQTKADIQSRKPPSYGIFLQDKDGGWFAPVDNNGAAYRIRFDPSQAKQLRGAELESQRNSSPAPAAPAVNQFDIGSQ